MTLLRGHPALHLHKSKPSYAEVGALGGLASSSHVQLASLFSMFIRCCASGFRSAKNLLGSTCALHGIYSVFVLADHLWLSSFFPVEFATPTAVAVLGHDPTVSLCNFCSCHR